MKKKPLPLLSWVGVAGLVFVGYVAIQTVRVAKNGSI